MVDVMIDLALFSFRCGVCAGMFYLFWL